MHPKTLSLIVQFNRSVPTGTVRTDCRIKAAESNRQPDRGYGTGRYVLLAQWLSLQAGRYEGQRAAGQAPLLLWLSQVYAIVAPRCPSQALG